MKVYTGPFFFFQKMPAALLPLVFGYLTAAALLAACASSAMVREYKPGTYEGTGRGYRGTVHVQVQTASGGIDDIAIISHRDSI